MEALRRSEGMARGLVALLAGVAMLTGQGGGLSAQTTSPLASPIGVTATTSPAPTMTLLPTHTPLPTFTPLPPVTVTPVVTGPILPQTPPPAPDLSWLPLVLAGLVVLIIALAVLALRRLIDRQARAQQPTTPVSPVKALEPPPAAASIEFTAAAGSSLSFVLDKPSLTLGRSPDNDIVIPADLANADTVSGHHAQFRRDQDDFIVRDLGSRNGLTVNGRCTNHNLLQDGDRVSFGAVEAIFHRPSRGGAA